MIPKSVKLEVLKEQLDLVDDLIRDVKVEYDSMLVWSSDKNMRVRGKMDGIGGYRYILQEQIKELESE